MKPDAPIKVRFKTGDEFQQSMSVMRIIAHVSIWPAIALSAGAVGNYFFQLNFWWSSLIAGIALIANGLVAEWEGRSK